MFNNTNCAGKNEHWIEPEKRKGDEGVLKNKPASGEGYVLYLYISLCIHFRGLFPVDCFVFI